MNSGSKSAQALRCSNYLPPVGLCSSCRRTTLLNYQRRNASSVAAVAEQQGSDRHSQGEHVSDKGSTSTTLPEPASKPFYALNCGVVLSRPPVVTRDLHPFESAYYLYQRRLNERLALPFTRYFYFKKGTPADIEWKRKYRERLTPAREIGRYHAYGKEKWNDELLVDAPESKRDHQVDMLLRDAETTAEEPENAEAQQSEAQGQGQRRKKTEIERPLDRATEADGEGDLKSLNRLLQRSLYLLVKGADGKWSFPTSRLDGKEWLNKAAERIITQSAGPNVNTWVVGNVPVGHYVQDYYEPAENKDDRSVQLGQKTFFMKSRIMAGQVSIGQNQLALNDFRWLAKEEIQKLVSPKYWSMTEDMLTER